MNDTPRTSGVHKGEQPATTAQQPREKKESRSHRLISFGSRRLSLREKINFSRHLSIIVKAGLPLLDGLKILEKQAVSRRVKKLIAGLIVDVNNGKSLSEGLERHKRAFGDFFISVVRVGEQSGTLSENLLYASEEMGRSRALQRKVTSAMIYPAILFIATVAISAFLAFVIFPKLITAFASLNVTLPLSTRILISTLEFLKNYWWGVLGGVAAVGIAFRMLVRIPSVKYLADYLLLSTPVVSGLLVNVSMANFTHIMGVLLRSGVKIVEALHVVSGTFSNLVYRKAFLDAAEETRKGETFSSYLAEHKRLFPTLASSMIEVGEGTGNLEENLFYLSEYYSTEVETSLKRLTALMEPLILLFMGVVVGFVAISIITPIYSITQGLRG